MNKVVDIISHQYESHYFKEYLYDILPLPELVIEEIIKNLYLAVDVNMKNEYLKVLVMKDIKINKEHSKYTKKKYRINIYKSKRYQLINYLQNYNIEIKI